LFVPKGVPPGVYTFVLRGSGAYPFSKDPKAKPKPNIKLNEPSNPIAITVRPAPVSPAVDNKGGTLKQGQSLEIGGTVGRQNGFSGPVVLSLIAPAKFRLTAAPLVIAENSSRAGLLIHAAKESPAGPAAQVFVRADALIRGETVAVDEPVVLSVVK